LRTFGIHRPRETDDYWFAVESVRSFEYPNIAVKFADYRRLNDASREFIVHPVDTPKTSFGVIRADGHANEVFPVAGLPVISIADPPRQRISFVTGDEIVPFMRAREALF